MKSVVTCRIHDSAWQLLPEDSVSLFVVKFINQRKEERGLQSIDVDGHDDGRSHQNMALQHHEGIYHWVSVEQLDK